MIQKPPSDGFWSTKNLKQLMIQRSMEYPDVGVTNSELWVTNPPTLQNILGMSNPN